MFLEEQAAPIARRRTGGTPAPTRRRRGAAVRTRCVHWGFLGRFGRLRPRLGRLGRFGLDGLDFLVQPLAFVPGGFFRDPCKVRVVPLQTHTEVTGKTVASLLVHVPLATRPFRDAFAPCPRTAFRQFPGFPYGPTRTTARSADTTGKRRERSAYHGGGDGGGAGDDNVIARWHGVDSTTPTAMPTTPIPVHTLPSVVRPCRRRYRRRYCRRYCRRRRRLWRHKKDIAYRTVTSRRPVGPPTYESTRRPTRRTVPWAINGTYVYGTVNDDDAFPPPRPPRTVRHGTGPVPRTTMDRTLSGRAATDNTWYLPPTLPPRASRDGDAIRRTPRVARDRIGRPIPLRRAASNDTLGGPTNAGYAGPGPRGTAMDRVGTTTLGGPARPTWTFPRPRVRVGATFRSVTGATIVDALRDAMQGPRPDDVDGSWRTRPPPWQGTRTVPECRRTRRPGCGIPAGGNDTSWRGTNKDERWDDIGWW